MTSAKWSLLFLVLPAAAACGQAPSRAEMVARQFLEDDRQPPPSDPKLAKQLEFLNECTAKRIRASDIAYRDFQEEVTQKVHAAMQKCTDDLYGKDRP